ncbi:chemotaxis protein CheW [Pendulispora albinea]|uniref:Chemotaxis protein CheW n=1 Tax=Pendulispora albinea TaxID=2741071 RepID=A0ABZ2LV66_9BACT
MSSPLDPSATSGAPAAAPSGKRGGLLVRIDGRPHFLPAQAAVAIDPIPPIVRVPGAPPQMLGIATHEGEVLPVITIGDAPTVMVVCRYGGELLGLVGLNVVGAGIFESAPGPGDSVSFLGEIAEDIDLSEIYTALQGGAWAGRWGG